MKAKQLLEEIADPRFGAPADQLICSEPVDCKPARGPSADRRRRRRVIGRFRYDPTFGEGSTSKSDSHLSTSGWSNGQTEDRFASSSSSNDKCMGAENSISCKLVLSAYPSGERHQDGFPREANLNRLFEVGTEGYISPNWSDFPAGIDGGGIGLGGGLVCYGGMN
jgi:hypothetical protein